VATFDPSWARDVQRLNLDLLPVERVSWDDSQRWLPRVGLRLPREAEWEKAARGGTTSVWWTGDTPTTLRRAANIADGSRVGHDTTLREGAYDPEINDGFVVSAPISSFLENPYGLGDVAGNVSEWCDDLLVPYALKLPREELARVVNRVHRGGSWYTPSSTASSAKRQGTGPDTVNEEIGVRAARSLDQPRKTR
jgi:formylglycine-generating enzyme required for sulfatase activity